MYSLDINLLSERPEYQSGKQTQFTRLTTGLAATKYAKTPLYLSGSLTVLALLAVGGGWLWSCQQTSGLEAKQKELDLKLGSLQAQDRQIQDLNTEVSKITEDTQALASVFNQIQPWSAVLQDLRESIPQGVQISSIAQTEDKSAPSAAKPAIKDSTFKSSKLLDKISGVPDPEAKPGQKPTPTPSPATASPVVTLPPVATKPVGSLPADIPTTKLDITGTAKTFEEVNNFMLTLKQSAFFNPDDTQLMSASLGNTPPPLTKPAPVRGKTSPEVDPNAEKLSRLELPKVVEYKIQTSLKRIPAADLMRELERKGAVGLVTRLKSLQQQQVIKP